MNNKKKRKIGKGLQYLVYDCGDGRVKKIENTKFTQYLKLISWGIFNPTHIKQRVTAARVNARKSIGGLKNISQLDIRLLGNPTFLDKVNYEQDKSKILKESFKECSLEKNKVVFDMYIKNILDLWKYGVADTVFNFTINNGVDKNGRVILLDLGELTFCKEDVAQLIRDKKWITQWSFNHISDPALKDYIEDIFSKKLTVETLNLFWEVEVDYKE